MSLQRARRQWAKNKARELTALCQGSAALEGQAVTDMDWLKQIERDTTARILRQERRRKDDCTKEASTQKAKA